MGDLIPSVPFCGPPPLPGTWITALNLRPELVLALLALALGLAWSARRGGHRPPAAGAWLTLAVLLVSPLCALSVALFSVRSVHHMALLLAVAPLLSLAMPRGRSAGSAALMTAAALQAAILWFWHVPAAYAAALSNDAAYATMELSLLAVATWFWWLVRATQEALAAVGALGASAAQMGLLGALLTFAPRPLYEAHVATTMPFGLSPLADQQLAGLVMWVGAMPVYVAVALAAIARSLAARPATA